MKQVVLSAGHDMSFYGAENEYFNLKEHTCALQICDIVMTLIRSQSRTWDVNFLDVLPYRSSFSHSSESLDWKIRTLNYMHKIKPVDLAIELHFNACESHKAHGAEVLYVSRAGEKYAKIFQPFLENFDGKFDGRGIKHFSTLKFLNSTLMPAIILEPLFLDNTQDVLPLLTYEGRYKVADAIVCAIKEITT